MIYFLGQIIIVCHGILTSQLSQKMINEVFVTTAQNNRLTRPVGSWYGLDRRGLFNSPRQKSRQ